MQQKKMEIQQQKEEKILTDEKKSTENINKESQKVTNEGDGKGQYVNIKR